MKLAPRKVTVEMTRPAREILSQYLHAGEELQTAGFGGTRYGSKAAPLDSLVITPHGLRKMGSLRLGSLVCNPDGTVAKVIGIYPQGVKPCYRITCDDGSTTRASADHLWNVRFTCFKLKAKRETGKWRVATTQQIMDRKKYSACQLPLTKPVKFTTGRRSVPPIDPYALGLLLGDGHFGIRRIDFSTADYHLIFGLECGLGIRFKTLDKQNYTTYNSALRAEIRKLGLDGSRSSTKFIPENYLYMSIEHRTALMQGLMDTDGYVDSRSHCAYTSVSVRLAQQVRFLAWSLGYKASLCKNPAGYRDKSGEMIHCQDAYTVHINGPNLTELFRLDRKKGRCRVRDREATRTIVSVEPDGECEMQCIAVDHPNSLYLTDDFIVTHNTHTGAHCIGYRRFMYKNTRALCLRTVQRAADLNMGEELKAAFFEPHGFPVGLRSRGEIQWLAGENRFIIPNNCMIQLGYCKRPNDWEQHLGLQWDDIWMEQAEQFPERVINRLKGSNRPNNPACKSRFLLTFNPGGIGSEWLERRVVNPKTRDRRTIFVKSTVRDCYATLERDPGYILQKLQTITDPVLRAQWLEGDWDAQSGLYFRLQSDHDETGPTIREVKVPYYADWYAGVDWGEGHGKFAVVYVAHWQESNRLGEVIGRHLHVGAEVYEGGLHLDQQAERALAKEKEIRRKYPFFHGVDQRMADPSTGKVIEAESTDQARSKASVWEAHGFDTYPAFRYSPTSGWCLIKYLMRKGILTIDPECFALIKEFRGAIRKEDSEDIDKNRCPNHALDALRYITGYLFDMDYSEEPDEETRFEMARYR